MQSLVTRRQIIGSLTWLAGGRLASQLVTWTITILVMRILAPEDYGLMALAAAVTGFIAMFETLGVGSALVQKEHVEHDTIRQAFGFIILFCVGLYLLVFISAPVIAAFFDEYRLTTIVRVLGLQSVLLVFQVIPDALLSRKMRFGAKSAINFASMVLGSIATLVLAWLGYGVWSLVYGNLIGALVRTVGLNVVEPFWCIPNLSMRGIGGLIGFGSYVTLDRLLWYVYSQSDAIIIGKMLGKEALGLYAVAMQLASIPLQKIASSLNEVGFAAFSRIQDDLSEVGKKYLVAAKALAFVGFPVFLGISVVAPEVVTGFLGEKWQGAILPLQALSLVMPLRLLDTITASSLMGVGRANLSVRNSVIAAIIVPLSILVGVRWGLLGVCIAILVTYPVYFGTAISLSMRTIGVTVGSYARVIWPPAVLAGVMYVAVDLLRAFMYQQGSGPVTVLLTAAFFGAIIYLALTVAFRRASLREFIGLFRR